MHRSEPPEAAFGHAPARGQRNDGLLSKLAPPPPLTFELLAEIATGPTARVELCRVRDPDPYKGQLLAVKRLHPHIAEDPQFASMFIDEVWMTAALMHPNVVRVAGWGNDADGTYLAVELVQGVSLARLMKTVFETREAFTERMVVHLGSELCAGLAAAHGLRGPEGEPLHLVHRDLTPGNVLIGFDGQVKIADFGLAKAKQRVTKTLTGLLKGHPQYMAPEQGRDGSIDSRADLFSLGVVLFELFTGRHPWSSPNELDVFRVMANEPPADLLALRPKLDRELAAVVNRLLERDPARRFQSADEVRVRLLSWLDTHGYKNDNPDSVARFVRRNAMRQMRWFERAIGGELKAEAERAKARLGPSARPRAATRDSGTPRSAAVSSRRRRRADDPTDVTDRSLNDPAKRARAESRLAATTPDGVPAAIEDPNSGEWSEEVPTVVKPTAPIHHFPVPGPPVPGPAARASSPTDPDVTDEDSDQRTTAVKPKLLLSAHPHGRPAQPGDARNTASLLRKLPPPRVVTPPPGPRVTDAPQDSAPTRPRTADRNGHGASHAPGSLSAPPSQDTLLDMPVAGADGIADPESEEVPTHPLRAPPGSSSATDAVDADLAIEADRLTVHAERLRISADRAAKVAAQRAVLAQLASEAAQLMREASRISAVSGRAQADTMLREAARLEASFRRGEAQLEAETMIDPRAHEPRAHEATGRPSAAPPPIEAVSALTPQAFPSVPPPPPAFGVVRNSAPPPEPIPPAMSLPGGALPGDALSTGAQHAMPLVRSLSDAPRPLQIGSTPPPPRTVVDELRLLLSGDVFGVPVPVALGVAFAVALGLVVLAALIVG